MSIRVLGSLNFSRFVSIAGQFLGFDSLGRLLVHGGTWTTTYNVTHTNLERYDPATNIWTALAGPADYHDSNVAYALDGQDRILFAGGHVRGLAGSAVNRFGTDRGYIYDPVADTWTEITRMPNITEWATSVFQGRNTSWATGSASGELWLLGGNFSSPVDGPATTYNHTNVIHYSGGPTGTWTQVSQHPTPGTWVENTAFRNDLNEAFATVVDSAGRFYLLSCDVAAGNVSSTPLRFDPSTNTWAHIASGGPSPGASGVWKAAIDPSDNIYVYGDVSGAMARYNQATDTWTTLASGPSGMFRTGTPQFFQGKLYLFGVSTSDTNIYVYDPVANTWAATGDHLSVARNNIGTVQDAHGVYIVGGLTASGTGSAVVEYWSPTVVASGQARSWAAVIG